MAVARQSSADRYLQRVGSTYYARVKVPRPLLTAAGQTHIRRTLGTTSKSEANLAKHAMVAKIKAELASLAKAASPKESEREGLSSAMARDIRERLVELRSVLDGDEDRLEALGLPATTETLPELLRRWLEGSDYRESTKAGHRNALADLLVFVGDDEAIAADVTRARAIEYIRERLTRQGLAHSTIRDRLVSLGSFWSWLASRGLLPGGANPWSGHRISKKKHAGKRPAKRTFADDELVALLQGNETVRQWPTYAYLPDLIVLGMYTGCREEELCSLMANQVQAGRDHFTLDLDVARTDDGERLVAVVHPAPMAVLKRRLAAARKGNGQIFPELKPGGLDSRFSFSAVKAFGRYRRACGVPDGTDFHSFRRNVIALLEQAGVGQVPMARFVGHKVATTPAGKDSAGGRKALALATAKRVAYGDSVEKALRRGGWGG